jgi:4-alpha-glucanotransferase
MQFPALDSPRTGVLLSVSSLRSSKSRGIGEFYDLVALADWCADRGISLIQILPINDTGAQTSPYSALSAFALHPAYISLESLPEYPDDDRYESLLPQKTSQLSGPVQFAEMVRIKEELLKRLYADARAAIAGNSQFEEWIMSNDWVRAYSVFRALREEHVTKAWMDWPGDLRPGSDDLVDLYWNGEQALATEPLFYAWVQYRLEQQLVETSRLLESRGVYLKGDLPILMNEDSADVWASPQTFDRGLRAGAPPDMFSELGQNWDFPIYNWEFLEECDFQWWKDRLVQADKYYHAYRIDHVLGFFRIWAIPARNYSGTLGFFVPYEYLSRRRLRDHGFDEARIEWLAQPHISGDEIRAKLGEKASSVIDAAFSALGDEDLYRFRSDLAGELDVRGLPFEQDVLEILLDLFRDRALIQVGPSTYFPAWAFRQCSRFESLSDEEKDRFEDLARRVADTSEEIWEQQGRRLLSFMSSTASMLTCAEDLGVVPRSVPRVLSELGILGLRIPRWTRHYDQADEPYFKPEDYPPLTICATSVHDTSTFRGWWSEDADRHAFWDALGLDGPVPQELTPDAALTVYTALSRVASAILLFQIQDLFDLDERVRRERAVDDRVNVPGTVSHTNWTYRWPITVDELKQTDAMNERIDRIVAARNRPA